EGHQGRHGLPPGARPLRRRTPGPGADGSPQYRQGLGRRHYDSNSVLPLTPCPPPPTPPPPPPPRPRPGQRPPPPPILRPESPYAARSAGAVHPGLPGDPARPPEGDHPPRLEALECPGRPVRRQACPEGH